MELLHNFFHQVPMAPLFLAVAAGYSVGKIKIGNFELGGMAGTLLAAVIIGQVGVPVDPVVKSLMFALFIYATGYVSGPQFFSSLNRKTLNQLHLALVSALSVFAFIFVVVKVMGFDKGTAAGLLAGATTESASIGTAGEALQRLGLAAAKVKKLESNIAVTYAITYLIGMMSVIFFASRVAPRLLGIKLKDEAQKLERELGGADTKLEPGQFEAFGDFATRVYEVAADGEAEGMTVGAIQDRFQGNVRVVRARRKGAWMLKVTPELTLGAGDLLALAGLIETVVKAGAFIGPETLDLEHLGFTAEVRDVVVTRKELSGKTMAEANEMLDLRRRYGVYATKIFRLDQEIAMYPGLELHSGDVVRFVGARKDVAQAAKEVGYTLVPSQTVDYVYLGLGILAGILVGMISVRVAGVPIGLGTGGGCLISGLVFGWLRAKHPTFGNLPGSTAQYLRDFGLAVFIASIGLASGPQAIAQIKQYGVTLPIIGLCVVMVPLLVMLFYGRFVLKMNPVILCGAITGNLTCTPALNGVVGEAESNTPVLGYTVSYAVSNVLLTFLGPVIVFTV